LFSETWTTEACHISGPCGILASEERNSSSTQGVTEELAGPPAAPQTIEDAVQAERIILRRLRPVLAIRCHRLRDGPEAEPAAGGGIRIWCLHVGATRHRDACPIRSIEAKNGLSFGRLASLDPLAGESEGMGDDGAATQLLSFDQIKFVR
jgi:hypothetical protein